MNSVRLVILSVLNVLIQILVLVVFLLELILLPVLVQQKDTLIMALLNVEYARVSVLDVLMILLVQLAKHQYQRE